MIPSSLPPPKTPPLLKFFLGRVDALPLRIFEIWMAVAFVLRLTRNTPVAEWLTVEGFHFTSQEWQNLGYPPSFPLLPLWGAYLVLVLTVCAAALLAVSIRWRRLALLGLFGSAVYVQGADYVTAFSANRQFIVVFFLLLTGPGVSLRRETGTPEVCVATVRAMQATLLTIYFASGWAKCHPGDWLRYHDVLWTQAQGYHRTWAAAWALRNLPRWAWTGMQYAALFFEIFAPVLLGMRRLRPLGFALGLGMHLMIALFMKNLVYFSLHMCGYYVLFVSAARWRAFGRTLQAAISRRSISPLLTHPLQLIQDFCRRCSCKHEAFLPETSITAPPSPPMNITSSLCLKILSLVCVVWAVLAAVWLRVQGAVWVPWVALVLLMLMDAYATIASPPAWSQWKSGLSQLISPRMLPFYGALTLFLGVGASQLSRNSSQFMPDTGTNRQPSPQIPGKLDRPLRPSTQNPQFLPPSKRPPGSSPRSASSSGSSGNIPGSPRNYPGGPQSPTTLGAPNSVPEAKTQRPPSVPRAPVIPSAQPMPPPP